MKCMIIASGMNLIISVYTSYIFTSFLSFLSLLSLVKDICSAPLGVAAQNGHKEIVEKLLDGGAYVDYQDMVRST